MPADTYATRWALAQWALAIWNPHLMDWIPYPARRRQKCLYYRAKGIVCHDRVLRGQSALRGDRHEWVAERL